MSARLLEERDPGDAGGQAMGGILFGEAAQREDREARGLAGLAQAVEAQRCAFRAMECVSLLGRFAECCLLLLGKGGRGDLRGLGSRSGAFRGRR